MSDVSSPTVSWNLIADFQDIWSYPFMVNAFRAAAVVAVICAVVGWFVVLRRQTFAAHTLSVVAFPGASGAILLGVSAVYGYFTFCIGAGLVIALLRRSGREAGAEESALTGTLQAFLLACGYLFIVLYKGLLSGPESILFGSFLGITTDQVAVLTVAGVAVLAVLALIGRPLLFATLDPEVAAGRGMRVRLLSTLFLVLLGVATAAASQITGTLLVFALLVVPPATAQLLTARLRRSLLLAVLFGLAAAWGGLLAAYYWPYPLGFFVSTFAFAGYLLAQLWRLAAALLLSRPQPPAGGTPMVPTLTPAPGGAA